MLAYTCKHCKRITVLGYVNEYNEHFCNETCYRLYCATHGYEADINKLRPINNIFNK